MFSMINSLLIIFKVLATNQNFLHRLMNSFKPPNDIRIKEKGNLLCIQKGG